MKHLDAIASGLFAILAVNGLYRPVKSADAVKFYQLGAELPRHLQWWTMAEYEQVLARRERQRRGRRHDPEPHSGRRRPRLRLVGGARGAGKPAAAR
jgi:hypothetical protein